MGSKGTIINDDGEIIGVLNEGDRIVRKESIDSHNSFEVWKIPQFYKGNSKEIDILMRDLTVYEKAFLFCVASKIGYMDCCIKHDNNVTIDFDGLLKLTGMKRTMLGETITSLRKKDILYIGRNSRESQYFVNPWIFCKGQRINSVLKTMFKNYKIRVLGVKWKDLAD